MLLGRINSGLYKLLQLVLMSRSLLWITTPKKNLNRPLMSVSISSHLNTIIVNLGYPDIISIVSIQHTDLASVQCLSLQIQIAVSCCGP